MQNRNISTFPAKSLFKDCSCSNSARWKLSFCVKLYWDIQAFLLSNKTWEIPALEAILNKQKTVLPHHLGLQSKTHPNAAISEYGKHSDGRVPRNRRGWGRRWQQFSRWHDVPTETCASHTITGTGFQIAQNNVISLNRRTPHASFCKRKKHIRESILAKLLWNAIFCTPIFQAMPAVHRDSFALPILVIPKA